MNFASNEDHWLLEYNQSQALLSEIVEATTRRRQLHSGNFEYIRLTNQLRKLIPKAVEHQTLLAKALDEPSQQFPKSIASGEKERRHRLCEILTSSLKKAMEELDKGIPHKGPFTKVADLGTANWGEDETDYTRTLSNSELRENHQTMLGAQEDALENLCTVVRSQKRIAKAIGSEVEDQDDLLIDIRERTDDTGNNLVQQTENVREATQKAGTCGYWIVILILLIAIIIVAVW